MIVYLSSPLLWELGTNFPQSRPQVKDCQFNVSPVNYSDSDIVQGSTNGRIGNTIGTNCTIGKDSW